MIGQGICNKRPPQAISVTKVVRVVSKNSPPFITGIQGSSPPVKYGRPACGEFEAAEKLAKNQKPCCGLCKFYLPDEIPQKN